ncbi:hypothetical protein SAMN05216360_12825 [Methylobacterium phyllostachyos]|uniref:RNA polymerase, alpha chain C terminal domain n=1 Tax=Methylobacterium phyllostachyos TaxID=582672 RepID=A0A1H0KQ90_9HYPH|nr:hypothetical protein [Methylobacterium phyllostachyos]SDO58128.1 hypothetical protein SAMN05216360_12825 [Methylobacterium phyllostachyos]
MKQRLRAAPDRVTIGRGFKSDSLFDEVSARLPLFEGLPSGAIQHLAALGFGRGFLTASLRARLRKAGYRDLGHLAQTSPEAIARVRKFGPVRVEHIQTFILNEIARRLPGARDEHAVGATRDRRLARLRDRSVEHLPVHADTIAALGIAGGSCADLAARSRLELLGTGGLISGDVDRIITTLARFLAEDRTTDPPCEAVATDAAVETEAAAAGHAALLAERDREWEDAAPPRT